MYRKDNKKRGGGGMRVRRTPPQKICAGHGLTRLAIPFESAITICLGILSRGNFLKGYARSRYGIG